MKNIKTVIINLLELLFIVAVALSCFYTTFWLCLIGGVIQIVEGFKATPISSLDVGLGVFRFVLTGPCFWIHVFIFSMVCAWRASK